MKKLITKFQDTGICEVDTDKVSKAWTNKFSISKYKDKYTLVRQYRGENHSKIEISKKQAEQIIKTLKLLPIQSSFFRYAITYRTESNIISEKERMIKLLDEKRTEISSIHSVIREFNEALLKRSN